jgi:hypothetical protein
MKKMTTITKTLTAAEVQYQPNKIKNIARGILHGAWMLLDTTGYLRATTTKEERIEMGVLLQDDER